LELLFVQPDASWPNADISSEICARFRAESGAFHFLKNLQKN